MIRYLAFQVIPLFFKTRQHKERQDVVEEMEHMDIYNNIKVTQVFLEQLRDQDLSLPVRSAVISVKYAIKDLEKEVDRVYEELSKRRHSVTGWVRGNGFVYDQPKALARIKFLLSRMETRKRTVYDLLLIADKCSLRGTGDVVVPGDYQLLGEENV